MTWLLSKQAQSKHGIGTGQARYCAQTDLGGGVELSLRWKLVEFHGLGRGRGHCGYCRHIADILQTYCRHIADILQTYCRYIADILPQIAVDCGGKQQIMMEGVTGCVP